MFQSESAHEFGGVQFGFRWEHAEKIGYLVAYLDVYLAGLERLKDRGQNKFREGRGVSRLVRDSQHGVVFLLAVADDRFHH